MKTNKIKILPVCKGEVLTQATHLRNGTNDSKNSQVLAQGVANIPNWAFNPDAFWNAVDKSERFTGAAGKRIFLGVPDGLSVSQAELITKKFINEELGSKPVEFAVRGDGDAQSPTVTEIELLVSPRVLDKFARGEEQFFRRFRRKLPEFSGCQKDGLGKVRGQVSHPDLTCKQNWQRMCKEAIVGGSPGVEG